jgi:uncharacterized integral membrane protein
MVDRDEIDQHAGAVHRRDAAHIIRLIVVAAIVAALIVVALDNRDDVRIGYAIGEASAPVWIVVVAAAISGVVIGWLLRRRPR